MSACYGKANAARLRGAQPAAGPGVSRANRVDPEDVVVAGRGLVLPRVDQRESVEGHDAAGSEIEAAADALAGAAIVALAANSPVVGDGGAGDGQRADAEGRAAVVVDPAAQAVAAV